MKQTLFLMLALLFTTLIGCGYPKVSGKVVFPDGSVLTQGTVVFENQHRMAFGKVQEDGSYFMKLDEKDGIPYGTYRISLRDVEIKSEDSDPAQPKYFVDSRFLTPSSSGLTLDVKKSETYMLIVDKPEKKETENAN